MPLHLFLLKLILYGITTEIGMIFPKFSLLKNDTTRVEPESIMQADTVSTTEVTDLNYGN